MSNFSELRLRICIRKPGDRKMRGISGLVKALGMVELQITSKGLKIVFDVECLVLTGEVPTLLSMKDMLTNSFGYVNKIMPYLKWRVEKASVDGELFLIHRWRTSDMPLVLYTVLELRKIHKSSGSLMWGR